MTTEQVSKGPQVDPETLQEIREIADWVKHCRELYGDTRESTTAQNTVTCQTMRVPVELLNRIRDLSIQLAGL